MELLPFTPDMFGGVTVDAELPADPTEFDTVLATSLQAWRSDDKRLAWIKLPIERAALVPVAVTTASRSTTPTKLT